MPTEKRVPSLIVNTLTEAQYQALENPSDTEMWVTPYDESILPDQTGQSGKFLTTDGTDASWADVDTLPSQSGQSGKFLTTDGTNASWATVQGGGGGVAPTVVSFTNKTGTTLATGLTLADYDTILVFKNGILLKVGASDDYTISTNNIVFAVALVSSDIVTIVAMGEVSGGGTTITKTHRALVSQITSSLNSTGFISLSNTSLMPWSTGNVPWEFEFTFRTPPASDIVPASNRTYCELVGRATSGDPMPTGMEVLLYNSDKTTYPDKCGVALGLSSTGSSWDIGSVDSGMIFNAFTYYTVKITYDLSKYQVLYKEGVNGSFTLIDEFTSSTPLIGTSALMLGGNGNNYNGLWTGVAIDIANTSMKSGNTVYFGGTDMFRNNNIQFTFGNIVIQEYDEVN